MNHQEHDSADPPPDQADVTVATLPVPERLIKGFGILKTHKDGQITEFLEKPGKEDDVKSFVIPKSLCDLYRVKSKNPMYLASMGIYVFKRDVLLDVLKGTEKDFGKEIIPKAINKYKVYGHVFTGYWRDIGTIGSFYEASLELTGSNPPFRYDTRARALSAVEWRDATRKPPLFQ